MNYFVHSLMYFYYFLMTLDSTRKAAKPFNWILTTLQTSQMVVGIYVTLWSMWFGEQGAEETEAPGGGGLPCNVLRTNSFLGLAMYFSYLLLFLNFAFQSYIAGPSPSKSGGTTGGGAKPKRSKKAD